MKRNYLLLLSALFIVGLLYLFDMEITNPSIATDSGFDTSYDYGGSWDSGSSWDSDSSWDYGSSSTGSSSSHSSGSTMDNVVVLIFLIVISFVVIVELIKKAKMAKQISKIDKMYYHRVEGINPEVTSDMFDNDIPLTEEDEERRKLAYQIYLDVQEAWMNFDYDTLKGLLTDELYHTYQNQLQTLELKGQKNIMSDFTFQNSKILSKTLRNSINTLVIQLTVSFYDYIVDQDNVVIRGKKDRKVTMTYLLTFVFDEQSDGTCPHCGAQLENRETVCPYCKTNIQGVTKNMRLSKKQAINQSMR